MSSEGLAVLGHTDRPRSLAQIKADLDAHLTADQSTVPQADLRRVLGV